jgi:hypothetical protein
MVAMNYFLAGRLFEMRHSFSNFSRSACLAVLLVGLHGGDFTPRLLAQEENASKPAGGSLVSLFHSGGLELDVSDPSLDPLFAEGQEKNWAALLDAEQFAKLLARPVELVRKWSLAGPFHYNPNEPLAQQQYPPEKGAIDLGARYVGSGGRRVGWQAVETDPEGVVDVRTHLDPGEQMMAYALAFIESPREEPVVLGIHSDDGVEVWLNGRKVHSYPGFRALNHDPDRVNVVLKPGRNELLLKVANNTAVWAYKAQILGSRGNYDPELHAKALQWLARAVRVRNFRPQIEHALVQKLVQHESETVRRGAARLARALDLELEGEEWLKLLAEEREIDQETDAQNPGREATGSEEIPEIMMEVPFWRVLDPVEEIWAEMNAKDLSAQLEQLHQRSWESVCVGDSGLLATEDLGSAQAKGIAFVQCEIQVTEPGEMRIRLNSPNGLTGWLDGTPLRMRKVMVMDLAAGRAENNRSGRSGKAQRGGNPIANGARQGISWTRPVCFQSLSPADYLLV